MEYTYYPIHLKLEFYTAWNFTQILFLKVGHHERRESQDRARV